MGGGAGGKLCAGNPATFTKQNTHTQKYNGERASEETGAEWLLLLLFSKKACWKTAHGGGSGSAAAPGETAAKGGGTAAKGGERPELFVLPAVKPVLAGIALDHEAGYVVGQPTDAIDGHRRHVSSLTARLGARSSGAGGGSCRGVAPAAAPAETRRIGDVEETGWGRREKRKGGGG